MEIRWNVDRRWILQAREDFRSAPTGHQVDPLAREEKEVDTIGEIR